MQRVVKAVMRAMFPEMPDMNLRPFPLRFVDAELEQAFWDDYFRLSLNQMRYATVIGMIALSIFSVTDLVFFSLPDALILIALRMGAGWLGFASFLMLTFSRYARQYAQPALALLLVYIGVCVLAMVYVGDAPVGYTYYVGVIISLFFGYTFMGMRAAYAWISGSLLTALYVVSSLLIFRQPSSVLVISSIFVFSANMVGMVIVYSLEYLARKGFYLRIQLANAQQRTEAILNNAGDAVMLVACDGRIVLANPAFYRLFRFDADDPARRELWTTVTPAGAEPLREAFDAVLREGTIRRLDVSAVRTDCEAFDAAVVLSPVTDPDEQIDGVVCSLRDVTQRVSLERQLRQAVDREAEIAQMRSQFISMASHDLRNPLAVIQSANELLVRYTDRLSETQRRTKQEQIQASIYQMTELLDDILIVGRMEHGKLDYEPAPIDLIDLCRQIVTELSHSVGSGRRIAFETDVEDCMVQVDPKLLRHMLNNLLSNAIKYSDGKAPVRFEMRCTGDTITLLIQDHGIGIPQADQERLFTTFFRATNVGKVPGTGLGLAIVKQCVELHGGRIRFESEEQVGTTFEIELPRVDVPLQSATM